MDIHFFFSWMFQAYMWLSTLVFTIIMLIFIGFLFTEEEPEHTIIIPEETKSKDEDKEALTEKSETNFSDNYLQLKKPQRQIRKKTSST